MHSKRINNSTCECDNVNSKASEQQTNKVITAEWKRVTVDLADCHWGHDRRNIHTYTCALHASEWTWLEFITQWGKWSRQRWRDEEKQEIQEACLPCCVPCFGHFCLPSLAVSLWPGCWFTNKKLKPADGLWLVGLEWQALTWRWLWGIMSHRHVHCFQR